MLCSSKKRFALLVTVHFYFILTLMVTGARLPLVYVDCRKGVFGWHIVDIGRCMLINVALYVPYLSQATLSTKKVHDLTIIGFEHEAIISPLR